MKIFFPSKTLKQYKMILKSFTCCFALLSVFSLGLLVQPSLLFAQTPVEQNVIESAEEVGNIILDTTSEYVPQSVENKATKLYDRIEIFRLQKKELVIQWKDTNYAELTLERENEDGSTLVYLIKHILLSILVFILGHSLVFYGLIVLIVFMLLRRIWMVFFGSRYG